MSTAGDIGDPQRTRGAGQLRPWRYTEVEAVHNNSWAAVTITAPASTNVPHVRVVDVQTEGRIPGRASRDLTLVMDVVGCDDAGVTSTDDSRWLQVTVHTVLGARTITLPPPMALENAESMGCH